MKPYVLLFVSIISFVASSSVEATGVDATGDNATEKQPPNIVFIFSDDQCFETIGASGLTDIQTPNLDRLAREGVRFRKAYNMGAWTGAVCVSSRTSLNTGAFLWRAKDAAQAVSKGKRKSWSQLMSDAGYETYMTGKWHIKDFSAPSVFNHTGQIRPGMPKQTPAGYNRPKDEADYKTGWKPWDKTHGGFWEGGKHWSEVLADESVGFVEAASKSDKPFFMYLAFNAPHDPRQAPKEFVDRYPLEKIQVPESFVAQYPDQGSKGVAKLRDENLMPYPRTEFAVKVNRQEYYASVTHMDIQIGRILDAIEGSGKAENTWIIFTSDHGLSVGHHGLVGKQNMYEDALCAPFIVTGPGIEPNTTNETPIYLQDAMPTALEIAGVTIPESVDFESVLPILDGRSPNGYDKMYGAYIGTQRMVMRGDWKLIAYPQLKKTKLFNLKTDPLEMNDLAAAAEHAGKLAEMTQLLEHTMDEYDDPMNSLDEANFPKGYGR